MPSSQFLFGVETFSSFSLDIDPQRAIFSPILYASEGYLGHIWVGLRQRVVTTLNVANFLKMSLMMSMPSFRCVREDALYIYNHPWSSAWTMWVKR